MHYKFEKTSNFDIHYFYFDSFNFTISFGRWYWHWYLYNGKTVKNLVTPICSIIWDKYI